MIFLYHLALFIIKFVHIYFVTNAIITFLQDYIILFKYKFILICLHVHELCLIHHFKKLLIFSKRIILELYTILDNKQIETTQY